MPIEVDGVDIEDINFNSNLPRIGKVLAGEEDGDMEVVWERPPQDQ